MTDRTEPVSDPRLAFYLERRQQIDEWASLRDLEPSELDRFLRSLADDARELVEELGIGLLVEVQDVGGESMVALFREAWYCGGDRPAVLVQIGWFPRSTRFVGRTAGHQPWVGVRARRSDGYEPLREALGRELASTSVGKELFPSGSPTGKAVWPRFRSVPCNHDRYWENLAPYRQDLLAVLREAIDTFTATIDLVVDRFPRPPTPVSLESANP